MATPFDASGRPLALPPAPRLFRFTLRQMLCIITFASILFAVLVSTSGMTAMAILLAALIIAGHVSGAVLGNQLRSHADLVQSTRQTMGVHPAAERTTGWTAPQQGSSSDTRSPLHRRGGSPMPLRPWLVVGAAIVGAGLGGVALSATMGPRTSPVGLIVGMISMAIMSGLLAFLAGSFCATLRHGLSEAVTHQHETERTTGSLADA